MRQNIDRASQRTLAQRVYTAAQIMDTLFSLLLGLLALFGFILWLWMLVDCATKESNEGNTKIVWIIIIVFTNIVGAVIYLLVRRPQRYRELHR
jgi:prolipoprotein diacylglyceryltransferase